MRLVYKVNISDINHEIQTLFLFFYAHTNSPAVEKLCIADEFVVVYNHTLRLRETYIKNELSSLGNKICDEFPRKVELE